MMSGNYLTLYGTSFVEFVSIVLSIEYCDNSFAVVIDCWGVL